MPIDEQAKLAPSSPYGESKLILETALRWAESQHGMRYACLRYFNAAGADPAGRLGEDDTPETHLIPLAIDAALGLRAGLSIFGDDYPTGDGTCIRDFIHVTDLCEAHLRALDQLDHRSVTFNVGTGTGHSVLQVVAAVEQISGTKIPLFFEPRRVGDPPMLIAASTRLRNATGWSPRYEGLTEIVETAYSWRRRNMHGYA